MEHETDITNLEIWAKAAELRELLKQMPANPKQPELLTLEEALAKLEHVQRLQNNQ